VEQRDDYLRFLNYLINDCIFLLDETLKLLPQVKAAQARRGEASWESLGHRERQEHECGPPGAGGVVKVLGVQVKGHTCCTHDVDTWLLA
jgi:Ubiquitin elongating factor core